MLRTAVSVRVSVRPLPRLQPVVNFGDCYFARKIERGTSPLCLSRQQDKELNLRPIGKPFYFIVPELVSHDDVKDLLIRDGTLPSRAEYYSFHFSREEAPGDKVVLNGEFGEAQVVSLPTEGERIGVIQLSRGRYLARSLQKGQRLAIVQLLATTSSKRSAAIHRIRAAARTRQSQQFHHAAAA